MTENLNNFGYIFPYFIVILAQTGMKNSVTDSSGLLDTRLL